MEAASVRLVTIGVGCEAKLRRQADVVHTAAVASEEAFYSNAIGGAVARYPTAGPTCGANRLEVKTFTDNPVALSDQIGFTVIVP